RVEVLAALPCGRRVFLRMQLPGIRLGPRLEGPDLGQFRFVAQRGLASQAETVAEVNGPPATTAKRLPPTRRLISSPGFRQAPGNRLEDAGQDCSCSVVNTNWT